MVDKNNNKKKKCNIQFVILCKSKRSTIFATMNSVVITVLKQYKCQISRVIGLHVDNSITLYFEIINPCQSLYVFYSRNDLHSKSNAA